MKNKININKILYIGSLEPTCNSYRRFITIKHLGYDIIGINTDKFTNTGNYILDKIQYLFNIGFGLLSLNKEVLKETRSIKPDIIWVDHQLLLPSTIKSIKSFAPRIKIISILTDDPFSSYQAGWQIFKKTIHLYDIHFVQRSENLTELMEKGAKQTVLCYRSYDSEIHKPVDLTPEELTKYKTSVGFIGSYAPHRSAVMAWLIQHGHAVAIYGNGWEKSKELSILQPHIRSKGILGIEYAKVINGMDIALHFLRKENRDVQDSRTFEIPACGVFMLAERSTAHEHLFKNGEEAVFFDEKEDLLEQIQYYLANTELRKKIAKQGRQRCIESGYDHISRIQYIIKTTIESK